MLDLFCGGWDRFFVACMHNRSKADRLECVNVCVCVFIFFSVQLGVRSLVRVNQIDVQFDDFVFQFNLILFNWFTVNPFLHVSGICLYFGANLCAHAALSWQLVLLGIVSVCLFMFRFPPPLVTLSDRVCRRRRRRGRICTFWSVARQPSTLVDAFFLFLSFSNSIRFFRSVFDQIN